MLSQKTHNSNKCNNISCSNLQCPQCPFLPNAEFIDTTATDRCAQVKSPLQQFKPFPNPNSIFLTDGTIMKSSHAGIIQNLPDTSTSNITAQVCPSNSNVSLISLGKLCDDVREARINKRVCKVYKENETMVTAPRYSHTSIRVMNL